MKYPNHEIYEKIYKRFFEKGVKYLIDKVDLKQTDKVIDLCGGNGRLTKELAKICTDVNYLDQEIDMIPSHLKNYNVKIYNLSVEDFVKQTNEKFDKVFCEQAINYWLLHVDVEKFANIINKDGIFIFNTFSNRPSVKPMIKRYSIGEVDFLEVSYLIDNKVFHIQIRENFAPHFTEFDWISKEQYINILSPYFEVNVFENGKSAVYVCKRK